MLIGEGGLAIEVVVDWLRAVVDWKVVEVDLLTGERAVRWKKERGQWSGSGGSQFSTIESSGMTSSPGWFP